ncbi:hypothetical protein [Pontibacter fetidus]|uniref:Uncharacterized protein n=1 Tax=Pontibacter fetidus TaxID=2700082 RepID=A0A6B2HA70_9BACT|nr:hypothetical protein [Pontibacter fetidus]NDK57170.1 hypothetical protein [Pontibacter fetidus]
MRHEQDFDDRHYRNRFNEERNRRPEDLQNAQNRWGEPDHAMQPPHNDRERFEQDRDRHNNYNPYQSWAPFEQRDNRHYQNNDRRPNYRNQESEWQRHNDHYGNYNQHANDRWNQPNEMHHPHHPRHASERFYREQRRRNW